MEHCLKDGNKIVLLLFDTWLIFSYDDAMWMTYLQVGNIDLKICIYIFATTERLSATGDKFVPVSTIMIFSF